MEATPDLLLQLGSRSGSAFALAFFSLIFGFLSVAVVWECRMRGLKGGSSLFIGLIFFLAPVTLIYCSSLDGFYDLRVSVSRVECRYLFCFSTLGLPLSKISHVEARPAFRGRWRLHLVLHSGRELESATWHREAVLAAVAQLQNRFGAASLKE